MSDQTTLSLLSGLIGSIIGAIIGGTITIYASKNSVKNTFQKALQLDLKKRQLDKSDAINNALKSLSVETKENLLRVGHWHEKHRKFRFSIDAWNINKQVISLLNQDLQTLLIKSYAFIGRYNTLIDYDLRVPYGSGFKDAEIYNQISELETTLNRLNKKLDESI